MRIWKDYQEKNKDRFLTELFELLRIPSVSTKTEHCVDIQECAAAVKLSLLDAGADKAEIYLTDGHPVVYGEKIVDASKPTVLIYGHYDVQPAEPLELWESPPFEPVVKDGKIFARGSCDDKGQFYMHVKALETLVRTNTLANNIKFCIEGEEEVGSPNLSKFVTSHKELLKANCALISDSALISLDTPSMDISLRGLCYIEVEVTGPNRDLHSGVYGGAVANPITALAKMIASLHDENNRITIPGFYDDVIKPTEVERKLLALAPFDEHAYKNDLGVRELWGEKGFSTQERTGMRPTIEVNGIWGGYTGEGAKTVLPAKAFTKVSARLVPNQESQKITEMLIDHFQQTAPPYVTVKVISHMAGNPYITNVDSKAYRAAVKAMETTLGKTPIPLRGGGGMPCTLFEEELGLDIVFMGFGLDSDNIHSPNEKFCLANFYKGIETILHFHKFFAEMF